MGPAEYLRIEALSERSPQPDSYDLRVGTAGTFRLGGVEVSESLVFVSHAAEDGAVADDLCAALRERGLNSWIAHRDVPVGARLIP